MAGRAHSPADVRVRASDVGGSGVASALVSRRGELLELQRSRLLAGAASAIEQCGYPRATVAHITRRAGVSRRTFYELFEDREACVVALFEAAVGTLEEQLGVAGLQGLPWRERVRGGLWVILCFFDREPVLARLCVLHVLRGGEVLLGCRAEVLARLASVLEEGHKETRSARGASSGLTAEGLVGAVFAIVHERLQHGAGEPLSGLLGELMGMIVLPYLGAAAAGREQARVLPAPAPVAARSRVLVAVEGDPLKEIPIRLTYRTTRVLGCISRRPGVCNREVAEDAGILDQGQISKLLSRLQRLGLTVNRGEGHQSGAANAWHLTSLGEQLAQRLDVGGPAQRRVA